MFLSLACPRLLSQLSYLCAFLLCQVSSLTGMERIGGLLQPYTPRPSQAATKYRSSRPRAKQPPNITSQDHAPSYSQVFAPRVRSPSTELAYTKASQRWTEWACSHTPSLPRPCRPQAPTSVYTSPSFSRQLVRPLRLIVFQRGLRVRTSKPDGYLQGSRSDHLRVSRSFDWRAASYPLDQAPTNAHHAFQVGCDCHTRAPKPISVSCVCRGAEARNTPLRRLSCQAREEKRKFSPTATSLRRRRQRSRT